MGNGTRDHKNVGKAEALVLVAEAAIQSAADGGSSGGQSSSADRFQIHVDLTPVQGHGPTVDDSKPIADIALERILCDPSLIAHRQVQDGEPLPSRKRRLVSGPLRRALRRRDGGFRFPGCTQSRFVDAHHILHWAHGGETKMSNLVLLCRRHHGLIHEGSFRVRKESDGIVFRTKEGRCLPEVADVYPVDSENVPGFDLGLDASAEASIHPQLLKPELDRKPPDYSYINSILMD